MPDTGLKPAPARRAPTSQARGHARELTIDPTRVLTPLMASATPGDARDACLVACAVVQFWADAVLVARMTGDRDTLNRARAATDSAVAHADRAARAMILGEAVPGPLPGHEPLTLTLERNTDPLLVGKLLAAPLPECCGYNVADVEICIADAAWLAGRCSARVLVAGIRSGGSVLAPLWAAALAARGVDAHWTTLRPNGDPSARGGYHPDELADARDLLAGGDTDLVVVDDLPDSGGTVAQLARLLVPHGARAWFAAVGLVEELDDAGRRTPARVAAQLAPNRDRRLWQLMLPPDRQAFFRRLSAHLPTALPPGVALNIRVPALEARYGRRAPWLPWNHPALAGEARRLVNPRKTPLTVVDAEGRPLWHLRFVGEGPWGRAAHRRIATDGTGDGYFVDGYSVSPHLPGLAPLKDRLANAGAADRRRLLLRAADCLAAIAERSVAAAGDVPPHDVGATLAARLDLLARRFDLADLPALPRRAGRSGRPPLHPGSGRTLYTSLRYAHGYWHWQVDAAGTIRRFQRETTWGGISTPELEVASFAMEHALPRTELALVAERCGLVPSAVVDRLASALLIAVEMLCRSVRQIDAAGRDRLHEDIAARCRWIARIAATS